jgi:hypothetical protein
VELGYRKDETRWIEDNKHWLEREHAGKWIAVSGYALIAVGSDAADVMAKARAQGVELPLLDVVPNQEAQASIVIRSPRWR